MRPNLSNLCYSELQINGLFRNQHFKVVTNNATMTASCTCPVSNPVEFLLKIQIACTVYIQSLK